MAKLVTVATDGFRDYVALPDGRQINLGSVSVLKLVTALVRGVNRCRKVLDTFLKNGQAVISVDLSDLEELLKPKRARWACHDDLFIPNVFRQPFRGASMNPETLQAEAINQQIAEIEKHVSLLEHTAREHAAGSLSKEQVEGAIQSLSNIVSKLGQEPAEQSDNRSFYAALDQLAAAINFVGTAPKVTEAHVVGIQTLTANLSEATFGKLAAVDEDLMNELRLYMENEGSLHGKKMAIITNIMRKKKAGKYDSNLAPKLWQYWVDAGADKYVKEFHIAGSSRAYFPTELRKKLAEELAADEAKMIDEGEYSNIKVAEGDPDPQTQQQQQDKQAGELPPALKKYNEEHGKGEGKKDDDDKDKKKSLPPWLEKGKDKESGELPPALKKYQEEHGKGEGQDSDQQQDKQAGELPPALKKYNEEHGKGEGKKDDDDKDKKKSLPPWLKDKDDKSASEEVAYYKLAATDVPIINEALAHSVMAKVELALGIVEASTKKNADVAKSDLGKISSKLSSLITGTDLGDPALCTALKELSGMADKIHSYFS
jgi:hypothetical protein